MSGKVDHSFCQSLERSWVPRCDHDWETRRKSLKERIHGAPTDLLTLPLRASKDSSFPYSFFLISYGSVCAGWEIWPFNIIFFMGPESDHWQCLSLTYSLTILTNSLTPV